MQKSAKVVPKRQNVKTHGRSLNSEVVDCLRRQATTTANTEVWLQEVEALRSQLKGKLIPVDTLVAATERDSH